MFTFYLVFIFTSLVGCALYVVRAASHISASVCVLPFCLDIQILRGMLPYPAWIYFSTLGGEDVFVRVGVKSEFIARWLPPRMRTCCDDGMQGGPALPVGGRFSAARKRKGSLRSCEEMENRTRADLALSKPARSMHMELFTNKRTFHRLK